MTNELLKAFDGAVRAAEKRQDILGRLGRIEPDGSITLNADRPGFVHVRLGPEGSLGQSIARNAAGVPQRAHLPVRMRRENGVLVIVGLDYSGGRLEAALAGDTPSPTGVPKHYHRIGSGMEYEVESIMLEPGRVRTHSGMAVWVNPFWYMGSGGRTYFPGGAIDLTSNKPSAGMWAWVLVGVDPATNAAVAETGDEVASEGLLTAVELEGIDFAAYIPCGAVKVSGDDTGITSISRFADAREWLNRGGGSLATLSDVELSSPSEDEVLMYIMGKWRNTVPIPPVVLHGSLPDLGNDDHTQYVAIGGRAGGQTIYGGTGFQDNLVLISTSNASKGTVYIGSLTGNNAIGLTPGESPREKLHIQSFDPKIRLNSNQENAGNVGLVLAHTTGAGAKNAILSRFTGANGKGNLHFILNNADDSTQFDSDADTRLLIRSDGDVGIGIITPANISAKLHVSGAILSSYSQSAVTGAIVQSPVSAGTSYSRSFFGYNAQWNFSSNLWDIRKVGANDASGILIQNGSHISFISHISTGNVDRTMTHAEFAAGEKMRILSNGNVGIGTTTPGDRLSVGSYETPTITAQQDKTIGVYGDGAAYFRARDITNDIEAILGTSTLGAGFLGTMTNHDLQLRTNNAARLTVGTTGNVGIGTTSPLGKLHIADGVVNQVHWAHNAVGGTLITVAPAGTFAAQGVGFIQGVFRTTDGVDPGEAVSREIIRNTSLLGASGSNTYEVRVTSTGAITVQRLSGSKTAKIAFWLMWI